LLLLREPLVLQILSDPLTVSDHDGSGRTRL